METRWQNVILDDSVFIAALLADEESPLAEDIFAGIEEERYKIIVPPLFFQEALNVLLVALHRKRIEQESFDSYLKILLQFPCVTDDFPTSPKGLLYSSQLALQYQLSAYHAAYLALAQQTGCPLATLDKGLANAARKESLLFAA